MITTSGYPHASGKGEPLTAHSSRTAVNEKNPAAHCSVTDSSGARARAIIINNICALCCIIGSKIPYPGLSISTVRHCCCCCCAGVVIECLTYNDRGKRILDDNNNYKTKTISRGVDGTANDARANILYTHTKTSVYTEWCRADMFRRAWCSGTRDQWQK